MTTTIPLDKTETLNEILLSLGENEGLVLDNGKPVAWIVPYNRRSAVVENELAAFLRTGPTLSEKEVEDFAQIIETARIWNQP